MKKLLPITLVFIVFGVVVFLVSSESEQTTKEIAKKVITIPELEDEEKTPEERALFVEERLLYEYYRQVNPITGKIPREEKLLELEHSIKAKLKTNSARSIQTTYQNRGPSNIGGRTRALVIDKTNSNIMLAGGVSSGVFRTTNGGASWTKVSSNDEIHNVTAIAQDPTNTNIWYYGTGESIGNSAGSIYINAPNPYYGQGIWKSTDGGINWTQMPITLTPVNDPTVYDNDFDFIFNLAVHPTTGDLFAAVPGKIIRIYNNGSNKTDELFSGSTSYNRHTDVVITPGGRVYAGFSGTNATSYKGVWTSPTGVGSYTRISTGVFTPVGRVVLALAPSNPNKLYVLFDNGNVGNCASGTQEADLWMWNQSTPGFTNYSSVLPLETCHNPPPPQTSKDPNNNPFSIQKGYDLVVRVKPDNENFVVIGGTNVYKKPNITDLGSRFVRIGGYINNTSYAVYDTPSGDPHHPDIHALVFDPNNSNLMYTGTDGGVHKTANVTASTVNWTSLNNNYQTVQYYHVNIDPLSGSDIVIGGAQDNGTTIGGTGAGLPNITEHIDYVGGDGGAAAISRDGACLPFFVSAQKGVVYRIFNGGGGCPSYEEITPEDQSLVPPEPYPSEFVTLFHLDPVNNNTIYYAAHGTLLRTTNSTTVTSSTWSDLGDTNSVFGHGDYFQSFATSWGTYDASSYLLMGGDEGHIYRLDDPRNAGRTLSNAVDITPPTATIGFPSIISGLAVHPSNNNIILATYANYGINSIYLSSNKGTSWTLVERNLSAHSIRSAAIVEDKGEIHYFVGTARGLYSSPDPTTTDWVREAQTQIGFALVSDLKYRPSDHKLLIGTHGNGMYEATISSTLGLEDIENISSAIKLYPNPVHDNLNIKLPQADGNKVAYSVLNLSGQRIFSGILDNESLNVSALTPGMYFLQIKTNDGRQGAKSFIKK